MDRSPNDKAVSRVRFAVGRHRDVSDLKPDYGRYRDLSYRKTVYGRLNINANSSSDQAGPADNQSDQWKFRRTQFSFEEDILDEVDMRYPLVFLNRVLHSIDSDSPRSHNCMSLIQEYFRRDQNQCLLEDLLAKSSSKIQTFNDIQYLVCDIKDRILDASSILEASTMDWTELDDIVADSFRRLKSRMYVNSIINQALVSENNFQEQCRVYVEEIIQRAIASVSTVRISQDQDEFKWLLTSSSTILDRDVFDASLSDIADRNTKLQPIFTTVRTADSVQTPADPNKQPGRHSFEDVSLPRLSINDKLDFPYTRRMSTSKKRSLAMETYTLPKFESYKKPEDYTGLPPLDRLPSYPKPLFPRSVSTHQSVRGKAKKGRSLIPPASLSYLDQTLTQTHARLTKHYNVWGP